MRRHIVGVAALALVLAGCDRAPTAPREGFEPQFASSQTINISGKGRALFQNDFVIRAEASFTCPEGQFAHFEVTVDQPQTGGIGFGDGDENCKDGPNTVVLAVVVVGGRWDIAKAHAVWTMVVGAETDTDEKDIMITAP